MLKPNARIAESHRGAKNHLHQTILSLSQPRPLPPQLWLQERLHDHVLDVHVDMQLWNWPGWDHPQLVLQLRLYQLLPDHCGISLSVLMPDRLAGT